MVFFITFLRALAACLITNAHYTGIYPTDLIANGGLIGDVLFFAVSGYCLYNIKMSFPKWYGKRIWRIYPSVILITGIYAFIGVYSLCEHSVVWWFLYPTYYHFIASIIVLYIPFYFCMKNEWLKSHILTVMFIVAVVYIMVYLLVYDKSYYHIDTVREPMIRFLFMESMFMGAWFKQNDNKVRNKFRVWYPFATVGTFFIYIISKFLFSRIASLFRFQILNQIVIFVLLVFLFMTFAGIDSKLMRMPLGLKKLVDFLSSITLEIYLVQYALIEMIRPIGHFPINWILLTFTIICAAFILHKVCGFICVAVEKGFMLLTRRK